MNQTNSSAHSNFGTLSQGLALFCMLGCVTVTALPTFANEGEAAGVKDGSDPAILLDVPFSKDTAPVKPVKSAVDASSDIEVRKLQNASGVFLSAHNRIGYDALDLGSREGFSFSLWLAPEWHGHDARMHPLLSFDCRTSEGQSCSLQLAKWPSGLLHFAVMDARGWVGSVYTEEPKAWLAGSWQHLNGFFGPSGIQLSVNGSAPVVSASIGAVTKITSIEHIRLGSSNEEGTAQFMVRDLKVRSGKMQSNDGNPPWPAAFAVTPGPRWVISPDMMMRCGGVYRFFDPQLKSKEVRITLDCPSGVVPGPAMSFIWSRQRAQPWLVEPVSHQDKPFNRYAFSVPTSYAGDLKAPYQFNITLATTLTNLTTDCLYLGASWPGGEQPPVKVPLQLIRLPPPSKLKRLCAGMSLTHLDLAAQGDLPGFAQRIGLNSVDLWYQWVAPGISSTESQPLADQAADQLRRAGITPVLQAWEVVNWQNDAMTDEIRFVGMDGAIDKGSARCPSDRTAAFNRDIEKVKNIGRRGCGISLDLEGPQYPHGCFCARCIDGFQKYLKLKEAKVPYVKPQIFEAKPESHQQLHRLWKDFFASQWSDWYIAFCQGLSVGLASVREQPPQSLMVVYDEGLWESGADLSRFFATPHGTVRVLAGPPLYHAPKDTGENMRKYVRAHPNVEAMPYVGFSYDNPVEDMRSQVFEVFGNGARGILFWTWSSLDGQHMQEIVEALNAVARVEDILVDGKPREDVRLKNPDPKRSVRLIARGKDGVMLLSDYTGEKRSITVELPFSLRKAPVDLLSGKELSVKDRGAGRVTFPPVKGTQLLQLAVGEELPPKPPSNDEKSDGNEN